MELPIGNVYQQSPRDERSTQWGPFNFFKTVTDEASNTLIVGGFGGAQPWTPPSGYVASIKGFRIRATPGVAIFFVESVSVEIVDPAGNLILLPWDFGPGIADEVITASIVTDLLLVIPNHSFRLTAVFNLASLLHVAELSVQSILLPKGNVALF